MSDFYEKIGIPSNCKVNKVIAKEKFYNLDKIDKEYEIIFDKYVNKVTLKYSLKSEILNIPKTRDKYQEYSEIEILEIDINNYLAIYDVATVIGRNIPYPLILIFISKNKFKIGSYKCRENIINNYKNVIEDIVFSGWFNKEKYFGRINNIITEINFENISHENMYIMFNSYYSTLEKYKSSYISIDDVSDAFSQINGISKKRKFILSKCNHTTVDENVYKKIDIFKRSKIDKYNNEMKNEKIMICKDDLYQFMRENLHIKFNNYNEFDRQMKFLKRRKDINDSLKHKHTKWDCCFFDGIICINSQCSKYEKACNNANYCELFKRVYRQENNNINNNLTYWTLKNEEENFHNIQVNLVEYGDTIELMEISTNQKKLFVVKNNNIGNLPDIPKLCIDNEIGYKFKYKNKEYKITNILKNNNQIKNEYTIMQ